eukprot:2846749-Prymnesium_polylepis.1
MDRRGLGRHPHSESESPPPCRSRVSHSCHVRVPRPRSPLTHTHRSGTRRGWRAEQMDGEATR